MKEIWKDIKGYEGAYQVSNYGNVRSLLVWDVNKRDFINNKKPKILTPTDNGNGYLIISLGIRSKRKNFYIHRLVATAFLEKIKGKNIINHKDYNKRNNNVENLEWCTQKENIKYSTNNMKHPKKHRKLPKTTGEKYIRKRKNRYEISIQRKYIGSYETLEEAKKIRDKEVMKIYGKVDYSI